VNASTQTARKLDHPLLIEACLKKAPEGYVPIKQCTDCQEGAIKKDMVAEYGKDNVQIVRGHFEIFKDKSTKKLVALPIERGCIVYVRKSRLDAMEERKQRLLVLDPKTKKMVPAGDPDYAHECTSCGDKPVVPQTQMCGVCTWGELDRANGNW
jgi:hypothetical protein